MRTSYGLAGVAVAALVGATACGTTTTQTVPGPTTTITQYSPGPTITVTATVTATATAIVTVAPTANAQGQATQISSSGVYVVGQDIQSGTWHTAGDGGQTGNQCYYALLRSSNTSDIIDNNNFDGPETVSTSGVYALQINGPCTWALEG
jgi:hypothetical protein